jgi:hypothetical protein
MSFFQGCMEQSAVFACSWFSGSIRVLEFQRVQIIEGMPIRKGLSCAATLPVALFRA